MSKPFSIWDHVKDQRLRDPEWLRNHRNRPFGYIFLDELNLPHILECREYEKGLMQSAVMLFVHDGVVHRMNVLGTSCDPMEPLRRVFAVWADSDYPISGAVL